MDITINNIERVLRSNNPRVFKNLFELLLVPDQNHTFVANYTGAIGLKFQNEFQRVHGTLGLTPFGRACVDADIVKTMLDLATNCPYSSEVPKEQCIAQYHALEALAGLLQCGDLTQRRDLLDQMLQLDVVNICLQKLDHPLCTHRQQAINLLRVACSEAFLGEKVTAAIAADIIAAMCKFTLEGPLDFVSQLLSLDTTWQSRLFMGTLGIPASRAGRYVPRYYAMAQESALWTVHGILCASPPPSCKFRLDILKKRPEIIDMLFDCAIITRPAWYPETQVDSIACEVLALLFQWPLHVVPGVESTNVDGDFNAQEWRQLLGRLISHEGWDEKIINVWKKVVEEDWEEVRRWFLRVGRDYHAFEIPDEKAFRCVFEYRGTSRIAMLRLITTVSHTAESMSNAQIESLLWIAHDASRKIGTANDCHTEGDLYTLIERSEEVFRSPMYTVSSNTTVEAPALIAEESVLGPTALARLLVVLAQRNRLGKIQALKKATDGLSTSTSLNQVQQVTNPDTIKRFLKIALQRVKARADKGRKRARNESDADFARAAYTSAAELAAALIAFDRHTQAQYAQDVKGARKELVLALGNASEMALRSKRYHKAVSFGMGALTIAEDIPAAEGLDSSVVSKNKRRVDEARAVLGR
ncbi:hypothetical protein BJ138DRAFT_1165257 [Hygrophoropsis aurantiaca]|uniref:Uncharacterized protein n=1 Tax=Hygrophoropsis aurantiaca TaxID=72124 RepID=A0ACB7ZVE1_9AGAM|nr:hypothetical protein BJ138DRAFT_1165257 [Hygrophoropsis aurantiaca]